MIYEGFSVKELCEKDYKLLANKGKIALKYYEKKTVQENKYIVTRLY